MTETKLREEFNRIAGAVEKHCRGVPDVIALWNRCCFFEFPEESRKDLPETLADFGDLLAEGFHLPFPICGIQREDRLIILWDQNKHGVPLIREDERPFGTVSPRGYIVVLLNEDGTIDVVWGVVQNVKILSRRPATILDGPGAGTQSYVSANVGVAGRLTISEDFKRCWADKPGSGKVNVANPLSPDERNKAEIIKTMISALGIAYIDFAYFNTPNRFVVQVANENMRERGNKNRIRRSDDRPFYTLLEPGEIIRLFHINEQTEARREVLFRRAHTRLLQSPRFTRLRGHRIFVEAIWPFDERRVVDKKRYWVMTRT